MATPVSGPLSFTIMKSGMGDTSTGQQNFMGGATATEGSMVWKGHAYGNGNKVNNRFNAWWNRNFMTQNGLQFYYWPKVSESYSGSGNSIKDLRTGNIGTKGSNCTYSASYSGIFQTASNSTGFITFPHNSAYNANGSFSMMAWVMPTTSNYFFIVHKGPSNGAPNNFPGNYELRFTPNLAVEVLYQPNTFSTTQFGYFYTANGELAYNRFFHIAVTCSGSNGTTIYIDGQSRPTTFYGTGGTPVATNTAPIYTGYRADTFYCTGTVGLVGIYPNTILTQAQIQEAFNGTNYFK